MNDEIWLPVIGCEGYEVSNHGRVKTLRRKKAKVMTPYHYKKGKGYLGVKLNNKKQFFVHRLVWLAFGGDIPEGKQINHKDGNHLNNHISNLECVTGRENVDHATENGLVNHGERQWRHKLTVEDVKRIKQLLRDGVSQTLIAKEYGVIIATINHIATGRNWKRVK